MKLVGARDGNLGVGHVRILPWTRLHGSSWGAVAGRGACGVRGPDLRAGQCSGSAPNRRFWGRFLAWRLILARTAQAQEV